MEVHQARQLSIDSEADIRKFQEFFEYMFERQGFRFFFYHRNMGRPYPSYSLHPRMAELGAFSDKFGRCCFEIGLAKPHLIASVVQERSR